MVHIATIHNAYVYTDEQIAEMCLVQASLDRGLLVVATEPDIECTLAGVRCEYCEHVNA